MRSCSAAHHFRIPHRCSLATTITDPGAVAAVAINKDGSMTASTTDLDINLGIEGLVLHFASCHIVRSCILLYS